MIFCVSHCSKLHFGDPAENSPPEVPLLLFAGSEIKDENLEGTELPPKRTETETNGSSGEFFINQDQ